jgi:hypothetical protein
MVDQRQRNSEVVGCTDIGRFVTELKVKAAGFVTLYPDFQAAEQA